MSRRKQAKPQQVRAEEEQQEGGQRSPTGAAGGSTSSSFLSWPELSQDQRVCTQDPLDLLGKERLLEDVLLEDCPSPSVASSDLSAAESADTGLEPTHDSLDVLDEGGGEWDEVMDSESSPQDKNPPTSSPRPQDSAESSSSRASVSGSYGAPSSNVTLEILHSTRVAVAQFSQGLGGAGLGGKAASIPVILERLLALQQQQVQQLQLIQQICSQVAGMNRPQVRAAVNLESRSMSLPSNPGVVQPPLLPLSGTMPSAVNGQAAVSLSQSVPSQTFCGQLTSASSEKTPLSKLLPRTPHSSSQTPGGLLSSSCSLTFLPQSPPSSVIFPNPLASIAASTSALDPLDPLTALMKQQRGNPPNMTQFEPKSSSEEPFFKHKCRFCAKVFGSDSALQIHLRSHTGERPFKCNICGNRFSTKGNLKVHFQRHKDKYPHVQMNPFPVPEYLDTVPTSSGIPYGMSVPPERPVSSWLDSKPVIGTLTANVSLPASCAGPEEPVSVPASVKSSQCESPEHRGSELRLSPVSDSSRETEASKALKTDLPPTLRAHLVSDTSSGAPTPEPVSPALLDSMQTSETSKLQRLVENIDKKLSETTQCSVCRRVLSCRSALRMHRRVHAGERPFRCKVCSRAFTTKGNLKTHAGVHGESPSAPPQHSCPMCQKKFSNAVVLQQHVRLHVEGQIRDGPSDEPTDHLSREDEEEENVEDEGDALKPLISDHRCLSLSAAAVDHCFSVKDLTNGLRDAPPGSDGFSSQNKTGSSPGVSESSSSPSSPLRSSSDASEVKPQQVLFASVKRERAESPKPAAELREEPNQQLKEEAPFGLSLQLSRDSVAGQNLPGSIKAEVNGHGQAEAPFGPGATSLLGPAPLRRAPRQHNCGACGKNFSSASALQIHERTHTGEKPFVCSVCGRAFTTKGNLKVHMGTHMWNNAPARRGRRLSVENPAALLRGEALKFGEAFHKDLATRAMSVDPGFWSRYASAITSSLALKNNEISVIQNPGLAQIHPLTAAGVAGGTVSLNKTTMDLGPSRHFSMLLDDSKQIGIN